MKSNLTVSKQNKIYDDTKTSNTESEILYCIYAGRSLGSFRDIFPFSYLCWKRRTWLKRSSTSPLVPATSTLLLLWQKLLILSGRLRSTLATQKVEKDWPQTEEKDTVSGKRTQEPLKQIKKAALQGWNTANFACLHQRTKTKKPNWVFENKLAVKYTNNEIASITPCTFGGKNR